MKKIKYLLLTLLLLVALTGCEEKEDQVLKVYTPKVVDKSSEINEIIKEGNYIILDVREDYEYKESHVKGAINIPYNKIDENTKLDKEKTILVYCKSGKRSSIAYQTLTDLGYNVYDMGAFDSISLEKE